MRSLLLRLDDGYRVEHHRHVPAVEPGLRFHSGDLTDVGRQPVQQVEPQLRVRHLAPAEHYGDLDLVLLVQEPHHVFLLGLVVVDVDLRSHLHLFDHDDALFLSSRLLFLVLLVAELAVIHDLAYRRLPLRGDLHKIQVLLESDLLGFLDGFDPQLLARFGYQAHLRAPDGLVDPQLSNYGDSSFASPASKKGWHNATLHYPIWITLPAAILRSVSDPAPQGEERHLRPFLPLLYAEYSIRGLSFQRNT